jgi:O-antigen/teichoic acid export membrane protein
MVAFSAIAVVLDLGYLAMAGAVASGYVAQAVVMGWLAGREGAMRIVANRALSVRLLRLALPLGGTLLVNYLYFRLDVLLLSWLRSDSDVGLYGLAYRVVEALMVLPSYLMLALFPEIARQSENRDRLRSLVTPALAAMQAFALPVAGLTAIFASQIVNLVGGAEYAGAAPVLRILMLALAISYLNGVYGNALLALGRQGRLFWLSVLVLAGNIGLNLALIPPFGVTGAAWAVTASEALSFIVVRRLYREAAGGLGPTASGRVVLAATGLVPALALELLLDGHVPSIVLVAMGGVLGLVGYFGLLLHFKAVPELAAARALLKRWPAGGDPS